MTDVTIAAEIAQEMAEYHREFAPGEAAVRSASWHQTMADLLDPEPPTLREQVAKAWCAEVYGEFSVSAKSPLDAHLDAADAVLAVVADWLAAQPLAQSCGLPNGEGCFVREQRGHDVRLLRGDAS